MMSSPRQKALLELCRREGRRMCGAWRIEAAKSGIYLVATVIGAAVFSALGMLVMATMCLIGYAAWQRVEQTPRSATAKAATATAQRPERSADQPLPTEGDAYADWLIETGPK